MSSDLTPHFLHAAIVNMNLLLIFLTVGASVIRLFSLLLLSSLVFITHLVGIACCHVSLTSSKI